MSKQITIETDLFEHILNCMCNQKYIHEQHPTVQTVWQNTIDGAWNAGMKILNDWKQNNLYNSSENEQQKYEKCSTCGYIAKRNGYCIACGYGGSV